MEQKINALNKIMSKHLEIPVEKLSDDISYELESRWDSVTHLKMISDIEDSLKIRFDIDEIVSLENVGKIREVVLQKIKGQG